MWILVLIGAGVATLVGVIVALSILGEFLRARRVYAATATPIDEAKDGSVIAGRVRPGPSGSLSGYVGEQPCVWQRVVVTEQVGKRSHVALDTSEGPEFLIDDGASQATVYSHAAEVINAPGHGAGEHSVFGRDSMPQRLREFIYANASFSWEKTPITCVVSHLPVDCEVRVRGRVMGGVNGAQHHVHADVILVDEGTSAWRSEPGHALLVGIGLFVLGAAASVGCLAWGGVL